MSNTTTQIVEQFTSLFLDVCGKFEATLQECGSEPFVVLIRALEQDPRSTIVELAEAWDGECDDPVDLELVRMIHALHDTLGPNWHLTCLHFWLRRENDGSRCIDETEEDCPLYGDDLDEVKDYWDRQFDELDSARDREEAAASAWLRRQAKKAA